MCKDLIIQGSEDYCKKCIYCDTKNCPLTDWDVDNNEPAPEQDIDHCLEGIVAYYEIGGDDNG